MTVGFIYSGTCRALRCTAIALWVSCQQPANLRGPERLPGNMPGVDARAIRGRDSLSIRPYFHSSVVIGMHSLWICVFDMGHMQTGRNAAC